MSEDCESKPIKLGICEMCEKDVYAGNFMHNFRLSLS